MAIQEAFQPAYDDVEIRIFRNYEEDFVGEISTPSGTESCRLDAPPIDDLSNEFDPKKYGLKLFSWLFREDLLKAFYRVRWESAGLSASAGLPSAGVRLRLWLDPKINDLHRLWWEAMIDPRTEDPLCLDMAFSRFLRVKKPRGWPITERPLRMLSIVSNPAGLERFDLPSIDLSLETRIIDTAAEQARGFLKYEALSSLPTPSQVREELGKGYHILHILSHALKIDDRYSLLLSDDDGKALVVPIDKMREIIESLSSEAPYFVFLATPMKADETTGEALVGFAPQLVTAGIQAVLAIQAGMDDDTLRLFTERFYNTLIRTGSVDTAMSVARSALYYYRPESWQWAFPVLYMRSPDGQLFQPLSGNLEAQVRKIEGFSKGPADSETR